MLLHPLIFFCLGYSLNLDTMLRKEKNNCKASITQHRLVGLAVKASASRAEGPGFESRWRRDFFGVESYQ